MKRLIFLLAVISLVAFTVEAQKTKIPTEYSAVTVNGTGAGSVTLDKIMGQWDVSVQLIPALSGAGDSLIFSYIVSQSNSLNDAVWTPLTDADTVGSATDSDAIWSVTDFNGLRLKFDFTGISTDTIAITTYDVRSKHRNE